MGKFLEILQRMVRYNPDLTSIPNPNLHKEYVLGNVLGPPSDGERQTENWFTKDFPVG